MSKKNTYSFKAEVNQLLEILVHSLYTNKEIFLRELVSNASDALDKYRYEHGLVQAEDQAPLEIHVSADKDAGAVTVADNGVGMTRDELRENLGTIAHSGSAEFARRAAEGKESLDSLIGRFGVGFYSVYMVADEVTVTTRSATAPEGGEAEALTWTSDGKGSYAIAEAPADTPRGTTITAKLKPDLAAQFADPDTLKRILKRHSNFLAYPIFVGEERVNTVPALWREPKFQIKKEQYNEFYTFLTYDDDEPLHVIHTSVDAPVQYNALLFVPKHPADLLGLERDKFGPDLYVRRVLIGRDNKELLPQYLGFLKGVVDTEDLPLNISRETLQDNLLIRKIHNHLTKQVLTELARLAKDAPDAYKLFWDAHSELFKTGYQDFTNRDTFAELLRFNSSIHADHLELTSLDEYIARAKDGQKEIYYLYGPGREALNLSPHLEIFRRKGIEVLFLYEPIDEFIMDALRVYKDFTLVSAEHADPAKLDAFPSAETPDKPAPLTDDAKKDLDGLLARNKTILGDRVTEVKTTNRLSESPVCLANPNG
ncbi:MAG: molecular chaperone HtpG, partial [Desulfovibrionaceae bacterium]